MGLDCTHDAWDGSYGSFHLWRKKLAEVAGLPPLEFMQGFYVSLDSKSAACPTLFHGLNTHTDEFQGGPRYMDAFDRLLPIQWDCLKPSPLHELLQHSDCDGEIPSERCEPIADELEALIPLLPEFDQEIGGFNYIKKTHQFVAGLRSAAKAGEPLGFY